MTSMICKVKDWAYDLQEMSSAENLYNSQRERAQSCLEISRKSRSEREREKKKADQSKKAEQRESELEGCLQQTIGQSACTQFDFQSFVFSSPRHPFLRTPLQVEAGPLHPGIKPA